MRKLIGTVGLLVASCLAASCGGSAAALKGGGAQELGSNDGVVGRHDHFGLDGYDVNGDEEVHLLDAKVVGVPDGMEVIEIQAVERKKGDGFAGGWDGDLRSGLGADLKFVPVEQVVFQPGKNVYQLYYIVVTVKAIRHGEFHTKGLELGWKAGRRTGTTFFPYKVGLIVRK